MLRALMRRTHLGQRAQERESARVDVVDERQAGPGRLLAGLVVGEPLPALERARRLGLALLKVVLRASSGACRRAIWSALVREGLGEKGERERRGRTWACVRTNESAVRALAASSRVLRCDSCSCLSAAWAAL